MVCLLPVPGIAAWTGIGAYTGSSESDWSLGTETRIADRRFYGLHIEESTSTGIRIGASIGRFDLRLKDPVQIELTQKFEGQFLSLYLRIPFKVVEKVSFHTRLEYQFNLGNRETGALEDEVDWNELGATLGLNLELGLLSVRPFIDWRMVDGDLTTATSDEVLENEQETSYGVQLDLSVEPSAYVRLKFTASENESLWIGLVREY